MNPRILQNILSLFNERTTQVIADQLGERHTNVIDALERIVPAILRGFASKSQEGPQAANSLMQLAKEASNNSWWQKVLDWIGDDAKVKKGYEMLQQMFGNNNIGRIGESIAARTRIRTDSAVQLMQWAAPLCLATIGKEAEEKKYDPSTLAAALAKLPIDIDGDGLAGGIPFAATGTEQVRVYSHSQKKPQKKTLILLPLLALIGLLALVIWLFNNDKNEPVLMGKAVVQTAYEDNGNEQTVFPEHQLAGDSTVTFTYGGIIVLRLPDGSQLTVADNSAEAILTSSIRKALQHGVDTTEGGKKLGWVNLYDVQFVKGTTYRDGAMNQMNNIAAILKTYPTVKIKIGGYTDNTGPDLVNARISQERADKVKADLSAMGVAGQIVKSEGYGPQYPIADNATPEGRALNRRVSCRIVSISQ